MRTREERMKIIKDIDSLIKDGLTTTEAAKKAGVNKQYYYTTRYQLGKTKAEKRNKSKPVSIPIDTTLLRATRMACVIGTPDELIAFIRGMQ